MKKAKSPLAVFKVWNFKI